MPQALSVKSLPLEILNELRQRLLSTGFGQYEEHADWLQSKGFQISKSSIHRYATAHASAIMAMQQAGDSPSPIEVRLRCLEVASSLAPGIASDLMREAGELLKWIYRR